MVGAERTVPDLWKAKLADNGDKDRVRDATDIVRLIGEHVALKPKGREFVGLCPFHNDRNPSMNVVPAKQIFHCFVCNAGGDCFSFCQKFHKMDFREALEHLAERAGIALTPRSRAPDAPAGPSRADVLSANATAAEFFKAILNHPEHGRLARETISKRGIAPDMVTRFMLGASPDRWDGLIATVQSKRLDPRHFFDAGLFKKRESSDGAYDSFRNRLMFPIQDQIGRVIAFGARKLNPEDEPKYLNSPETRLFNKSATLYALNHAAKSIQAERTALITEGYTDVIACHQAGFTNAVATLGTALTREHASVLRRLCDRIVLLFDGDEAGQRAADRAAEVFFSEDLDVSIATLNKVTDAKDPDELLKREDGPEVFRRALAASTDLLDYRFARLRERLQGAGMAALARAMKDEITRLVELGLNEVEPIRQKLIVKRLAAVAGLDEATILSAIPAGRRPRPASPIPPTSTGDQPPAEQDDALPNLTSATLSPAEHLLGCALCDGALLATLSEPERDFLAPAAYRSALLRLVAQTVHDLHEDHGCADLPTLLRSVEDESIKQTAVALASRIDHETDRSRDRLHAHWHSCLNTARHDAQRRTAGDATDLIQQIKLKRAAHASLGADRRVFPRPS